MLRFLKVYDFDIDKAKDLLILNLETRKKNPNIFLNRDVRSEEFKMAMSTMQCCALPKNTKENHKISVFRLVDNNPNNFSYIDIVRMVLAQLDARLIYCDPNELIDGEISIIDLSGFGFKHFTKIFSNLSMMKAYFGYAQEAAPIKIVQSNFVNCPAIMGKVMTIIKPFLKKEVWETIKMHSSLESLYECIPKDLLPIEYNGSVGCLDEFHRLTELGMELNRDYLLCDDNWNIKD